MAGRKNESVAVATAVAIALVVVLVTLALVAPVSSNRHHPSITVFNHAVSSSFKWFTEPNSTTTVRLGGIEVSSYVVLNATMANSSFSSTLSVYGDSSVDVCHCGVTQIFYILFVNVSGSLAAGLDPASVSIEFDNFGVNSDPNQGTYFLAWPGQSPVNARDFPVGGPYSYGGTGSLSTSANLVNERTDRSSAYQFSVPLQVQVQLAPIANDTVGSSDFHVTASLLGLGQSVTSLISLQILNDYS